MTHEVETHWMGNMQFNAAIDRHTIVMDAPEISGGSDVGPFPKPLILAALSGCTGMDVAAILRKKRKPVDEIKIEVSGTLRDEFPKEYIAVHIAYKFKGPAENQDAALKAVKDSQEKYCGVSALLRKALPLTWEVFYNDFRIFTNKA